MSNIKQAFPVLVKYITVHDGDFPDDTAKAQLMHWYASASIWGYFAGATPNKIDGYLAALKTENAIDSLHNELSREYREVAASNFNAARRRNKRFYSLLEIMSQVWGAKDWGTGLHLPNHPPSRDTQLERHHIFPQKILQEAQIPTDDINNIGNLALQTRKTNRAIRDRSPADYMQEVVEHHPGALESQWVPNTPELWVVDKYYEFLEERRRLLAEAANQFLNSLRSGVLPTPVEQTMSAPIHDEDEAIIDEINNFATENGLSPGELGYEIIDKKTKELITTLDLAWPKGLQEGLSEPVAILIDEDNRARKAANADGFVRLFTTETARQDFIYYVQKDILGEITEESDAS